MNTAFMKELMSELNFPAESRSFMESVIFEVEQKAGQEMQQARDIYISSGYDWPQIEPLLEKAANISGMPLYSINLILLLSCCEELRAAFAAEGIESKLFLDTVGDLRCKLYECREVYGIWGNFVPFWYKIFFQRKILTLGRLEYEDVIFNKPSQSVAGFNLKQGTAVKSLHIPSGSPLTEAAYMESYRQAYDFFKAELVDGILVCVCESWLLHPSTNKLLSPTSNTVKFVNSFELLSYRDMEKFEDKWRVFGKDFEKADVELPETSSMQRAYKAHILSAGKLGEGYGVLLFDGHKILTF